MFAVAMNAQDLDEKIQELIAVELISSAEATDFKNKLSEQETISNGKFIYFLFENEFKKTTGYNYSDLLSINFDFHTNDITIEEQNSSNKIISDYLLKLNKVGLVTDKQFKEQYDKVNNNAYVALLQFLMDIRNQVFFEEWISKVGLNDYRTKLFNNKIISEKENKSLIEAIQKNQIESPYQLIDYCSKARFFDLSTYSNDPAIYLEQIHKKTAEILPELSFDDFSYAIKKNTETSFEDDVSYDVIVSIKSKRNKYKLKSFIAPDNIGEDYDYLGKIDSQNYYQLFNKILKDLNSSYRLHLIKSSYNYQQQNSFQYFGIVALKEDQLQMFRYLGSYWTLSYEDFENSLTTKEIKSAINKYRSIGLLEHLSDAEINSSIEEINLSELPNLNYVLSSFPNIILSFDYELINIDNPYEELIREYSKISHLDFNPENIKGDFNSEKEFSSLRFECNKKEYKAKFKIDSDWIDENFFDFMKFIAKDLDLKGQFYQLNSEHAMIIYLTPKQYEYIKKHQLLSFADE